jgi:hypothetical protein
MVKIKLAPNRSVPIVDGHRILHALKTQLIRRTGTGPAADTPVPQPPAVAVNQMVPARRLGRAS